MVADPADPRLDTYEGVLPGFDPELPLDGRMVAVAGLAGVARVRHASAPTEALGHRARPPGRGQRLGLPVRRASSPGSTARTGRGSPMPATSARIRPTRRPGGGRPGTPPTRWVTPLAADPGVHPLVRPGPRRSPVCAAPTDPADLARLRSQYFGMVSEVDDQLGPGPRPPGGDRPGRRHPGRGHRRPRRAARRPRAHPEARVLRVELLPSRASCRPPGRSRHRRVGGRRRSPRRVDVLPTIAELLGQEVPVQCDGASLVPFLDGREPRPVADGGPLGVGLAGHGDGSPPDRRAGSTPGSSGRNLAVERTATHAYVQFADGSWLCFDLAADPDVGTRPPRIPPWCSRWPSRC